MNRLLIVVLTQSHLIVFLLLQEEYVASPGIGAQLARPPVKPVKEKVNIGQ
jgi:hypothetical protein